MTKSINNLLLLALGALLVTAPISAQENAASDNTGAEGADDLQEYREHHREMIKKVKKHHKRHMKQRLEKLDTNDDGKVDLTEYLTNAEQRFNELDINGDQYVTEDEARQKHREMRKMFREKRKDMRDSEYSEE